MNILQATRDRNLLGSALIGDPASWQAWRGFLAAFFGLPLDGGTELYRACTGRGEPPSGPFRRGYLICGRGGGKSYMCSLIVTYLACFVDWSKGLALGGRPVVLLVAPTTEQAKIDLAYVHGILEGSPILRGMLTNRTATSVELRTRTGIVEIQVVSANFRSIRGRAICAAVIDESAFLRQEESSQPDIEIVNAITPALGRFGKRGVLLVVSTPYSKRGVLYQGYRKYFGSEDADSICWVAPTLTMNPSFDQDVINEALEEDRAKAGAEYLCEWRSDIESYVSIETVEGCVMSGVREIPPAAGTHYHGFVDASGGGQDSFTMGISHRREDGIIVLDCVREVRPKFSPDSVTTEFAEVFKQYHVLKIFGDDYGGEWPKERFANNGITYESISKPRSDIYKEFAPLLHSGSVELLDNQRMITQIHGLERRVRPGGRDVINHAPNSHDDVANAAAGAVVLANFAKQPMIISDAVLRRSTMRCGGYLPSQMPPQAPCFQPGSFSDRFGGGQ
jgi:hypothetical protein